MLMIIKAERSDKERVVELLTLSFKDNLSTNYITGGGEPERLTRLMAYAFEVCFRFGQVWLTEKKDGCALVVYPHLKKFSLASVWLDMKLLFGVIGVSRFAGVLRREKLLAIQHPSSFFCYLWFIGVNPWVQGQGNGGALLAKVVSDAQERGLPIYLETSTLKNVFWYEKRGFVQFHELDLGYRLLFFKRDADGEGAK